MATSRDQPIIVVVGPTASGKSALAVALAKEYNGEIICADSRTIYTGMDIGTAKPLHDEQQGIQHWGIDLVEPDKRFTVADFKQYATAKITDIQSRGHRPIVVGGTGLYIDSLLFDYQFRGGYNAVQRHQLETMSIEQLINHCKNYSIALPADHTNKRRLIRVIEAKSISTISRARIRENVIVVGIATSRALLRTQIISRTEQMFANGVVEEATMLGKKYGWNSEAMTGNVYPAIKQHLENKLSLDDLKNLVITRDWQLAKRQMTWFQRNPYILWDSRYNLSARVANLLHEV